MSSASLSQIKPHPSPPPYFWYIKACECPFTKYYTCWLPEHHVSHRVGHSFHCSYNGTYHGSRKNVYHSCGSSDVHEFKRNTRLVYYSYPHDKLLRHRFHKINWCLYIVYLSLFYSNNVFLACADTHIYTVTDCVNVLDDSAIFLISLFWQKYSNPHVSQLAFQQGCSFGSVFSYKLRYIVGFWLVEMCISTNQKPMIHRNLHANTDPASVCVHRDGVVKSTKQIYQSNVNYVKKITTFNGHCIAFTCFAWFIWAILIQLN